ncbi:MAG: hypothetical protein KDD94_04815 [Calditrichaeota bacterium]|nr:hypothetical protein [Calditrichota bacterium]
MKTTLISTLFFLFACETKLSHSDNSPKDLLVRLQSIPGFTVTEITPVDHFQRLFEIHLTQYIDHTNPSAGTFQQKIFLGHVSESAPVILETEGYSRDNQRTRQLSALMEVNQLAIEHRYYGESVPNPRNWQYLTIDQASNDIHRIIEKIKTIYTGKWASSGRSKG